MDAVVRPALFEDAEAISRVIRAALRQSNAKDYPPSVIARVEQNFNPMAVLELLARRTVLVAEVGGALVATASLDGAVVRTVFVDPATQGLGVGRRLLFTLEEIARGRGMERLDVPSSLTAVGFYARLGYQFVQELVVDDERTIIMSRRL